MFTCYEGIITKIFVNGIWRSLRSATEGDENGLGRRDITSMPRAIEAEYGLAMRGCL